MRRTGKKAAALAVTAALAVSAAGCGSVKDSDVVVTIGGEKVTVGVANFFARYQQAEYETYYSGVMGEDMWSTEISKGKSYEETVKNHILETLENMYVLEDHMGDYKVEITEEEKKKISEAAKAFDEANGLEEKEAVSGTTENVERMLTLVTIQEKMQKAMVADVDTEVSDEEAAQKSMQYVNLSLTKTKEDGSTEQMTEEEKAEAKKKAEAFQKAVKEGADFAKTAKEKELEVKTMTFDEETTTPDEGLMTKANKLGEGEVSEVIETDSGYYVLKVTSLLDREATDAEKESIAEERKEKQYKDLCEEWKKDVKIEVNEKVWDKISFEKKGIKMKQQEEIQQVYDKYGTSMSAGCLPLLIQMPLLFALYPVIYNIQKYVPEIKTAPKAVNVFLTLPDLTISPMQMIKNSGSYGFPAIMIIITAILLPVLSGLTQYGSIKLSQAISGQQLDKDNPMASTMNTMNITMPLFSVFMVFSLPTGIGLYWIVSAVVRCVQQVFINKHLSKISVEEILEQNKEKAEEKRVKRGEKNERIAAMAQMNTKNMNNQNQKKRQSTSNLSEKEREAKVENAHKKAENAKKGSLASKANMVKKFNEND